jgi:hypothetical protein
MKKGEQTWKKVWLLSVVFLFMICSLGVANEPTKGNKDRVIVDLIQQRNGCNDCHKGTVKTPDGKEKDVSLAAEARNIPKHPRLDVNATLKECMKCHETGERKARFINTLHDIHLNSLIYVGEFKQTCSGCHNMKYIKGM